MIPLVVDTLALCDYALISQEGKLSMIGIFDRMFVDKTPAVFARFFLVSSLSGEPETSHKVTLSIETGAEELLPGKELEIKLNLSGKANIITDVINLALPYPGDYKLKLKSETGIIGEKLFSVKTFSSAEKGKVVN